MKKFALFLFIFCVATTSHSQSAAQDFHSYSNPQDVRVRHLDLDWDVSFDKKILKGAAVLTIDRLNKEAPLVLDTRLAMSPPKELDEVLASIWMHLNPHRSPIASLWAIS